MDSLFLRTEGAVEVRLHPVVMSTVLDHHMRRSTRQHRVMGALMGYTTGSATVVATAIPVYHEEDERGQYKVKRNSMDTMLALHKRVNPSETVLGWYATATGGDLVSEFTCAMHELFVNGKYCGRPIHMVVDMDMRDDHLAFHAFEAVPNPLLQGSLALFQQVPVVLHAGESERVGLDAMMEAERSSGSGPQLGSLLRSMRRLRSMLDTVGEYVDQVSSGAKPADPMLGRAIADALAAVPRIEPAKFDSMFNASLQDLLMVVYLSGLTQAQLALADHMARTIPYQ